MDFFSEMRSCVGLKSRVLSQRKTELEIEKLRGEQEPSRIVRPGDEDVPRAIRKAVTALVVVAATTMFAIYYFGYYYYPSEVFRRRDILLMLSLGLVVVGGSLFLLGHRHRHR